jgi:small ligand-binding sensory domain FIST
MVDLLYYVGMNTSQEKARFGSALSTAKDSPDAFRMAIAKAREALFSKRGEDEEGVEKPSLAMIFCSPHHAEFLDNMASFLPEWLGTETVIGCTGESILGRGTEIEFEPAVSVWLARFPSSIQIDTVRLSFNQTADGGVIEGWPEDYSASWPDGSVMTLLGDPYTFPADLLLEQMNEDRPGVRVIGGMASASSPGGNRLICGGKVYRNGAVFAMLRGPVRMRTVVSQGCRPIGKPFVVTKSERNVIHALGGKPALLQLKEIFDSLPTREQHLVQNALHLGRVVSEYQDHFEPGDFLIRNVMGWDPKDGSIAIGDFVRVGQTVQFHIRDAEIASVDLRERLQAARSAIQGNQWGALMFTCNGRGTHLFQRPNHDANCLESTFADTPVAGFFAAGEIGPVGKQNFMHGFTASIAIFEP